MAATDMSTSAARHDARPRRPSGACAVGEFRCSECGYGIVSRTVLPVCPMCRGSSWDESPWRPFTRPAR